MIQGRKIRNGTGRQHKWRREEAMEAATNKQVLERFAQLYEEVFAHDGYGDIRLEMKILRRGQKEVIIHCGKQYRFVVDFANTSEQS